MSLESNLGWPTVNYLWNTVHQACRDVLGMSIALDNSSKPREGAHGPGFRTTKQSKHLAAVNFTSLLAQKRVAFLEDLVVPPGIRRTHLLNQLAALKYKNTDDPGSFSGKPDSFDDLAVALIQTIVHTQACLYSPSFSKEFPTWVPHNFAALSMDNLMKETQEWNINVFRQQVKDDD